MCWIGMDWKRKKNTFCLLGDSPAKAVFWKGNLIWKSSYQSLQTICCVSGRARVNFCSRQEWQCQDSGVIQGWPLSVWRGHRGSGVTSLGFARDCARAAPGSASWATVNPLLLLCTLSVALAVLVLISLLFLINCLCLSLWSLPFCAANSPLQPPQWEGRREREALSEVFQWKY